MERHHLPNNFTSHSTAHASSPKDTMFDVQGVDVYLSKQKILQNINLKILRGDFTFLTGHTGAGKTTLLSFLSGEIEDFTGRVTSPLWSPTCELFVSRIFQDLKLFDELSVIDNLVFSYDPMIYPNQASFNHDMMEFMKVTGLLEYENKKLCKLSGGLKQKVAILRSLLSKPDILLADEPTSNLDRVSSLQLFELLNYMNVKRKMTIIWATHNLELIKQFHGRLISLEKGKIVYSGAP